MGDKLLILDIGSSALKAVLFDSNGAVIASAAESLSTQTRPDRSVEQSVAQWWEATRTALAKLPCREDIIAIGLTGSMQNLIALSPDGTPAGPAILYSDRRLNIDDVEALRKYLPADYGVQTGNHLDAAHPILKIMRLDRFYPVRQPGEVSAFLFGAKDAVIHRLTGRLVIDPTTATTTGLYDIRKGSWSAELVKAAGIEAACLPDILPADAPVGPLLDAAAGELGLPPGIAVYTGAGDGAAATWGAFADAPNSAYAYLGTTGWVAATMLIGDAAPPRASYTLADPVTIDRAIVISPFLSAGSALDWLAETTSLSVEALLERAGSDEGPTPIFLPYLLGERSPFEDQAVRGAFLGLDRAHGPGALCRAVLEGIAFAIRHNIEAANLPLMPITVIGGGARSALQLQLLADALNRTATAPAASQEMPALGIYRMIAPQLGFASVERLESNIVIEPRAAFVRSEGRRYRAYLSASQFARDLAKTLA